MSNLGLSVVDIEEIPEGGPLAQPPPGTHGLLTPQPGAVKRLSQRHHRLAQLLASGAKPAEAAAGAGYCLSRVSILQADRAFQLLVQQYREAYVEQFLEAGKKLADLNETVIDELHTRLEEKPEELSNNSLIELLKIASDRTGLGPQSTQRNINVTLTPEQLDELKRNAIATQKGNVKVLQAVDPGRESNVPIAEKSEPEEGPSV